MRGLYRSAGIAGAAVSTAGGFANNAMNAEVVPASSAPAPVHFILELPGTGLGLPTLPDNASELMFPAPGCPRPAFARSVFPLQVMVLSSILTAAAAAFVSSETSTFVPAFLMSLIIIVIVWRYRSEPAVMERLQARMRLRAAERVLESTCRRLAARDAKLRELRSAAHEQLGGLQGELQDEVEAVMAAENREHQMLERAITRASDLALQHLERLDHQEEVELQRAQGTLGAEVCSILEQINQSILEEGIERTTALQNLQEEHVQQQLERRTLEGAIPGVGPFLTMTLAKEGIRTAADCIRFTEIKVLGVGPQRVAAILAWRKELTAQAKVTMPTVLSAGDEKAIQDRHAPCRALLQAQLLTAEDALKTKQKSVRDEYANLRGVHNGHCEISTHRCDQARNAVESKRRREALESAISRVSTTGSRVKEVAIDNAGELELLKSLLWRVDKAKAELRWFEPVSFPRYVRRVVNEK